MSDGSSANSEQGPVEGKRYPLIYGKDIPVVKPTADVPYTPYGASWWFDDDEMPADRVHTTTACRFWREANAKTEA